MKIRAARVKGLLPTMPEPMPEKEKEALLELLAERDVLEQKLIKLNSRIMEMLNGQA